MTRAVAISVGVRRRLRTRCTESSRCSTSIALAWTISASESGGKKEKVSNILWVLVKREEKEGIGK